MCLDCGCVLAGTGTPDDDHGDPRHLTLAGLAAAAAADGVSVPQALATICSTVQAVYAVDGAELVAKDAGPAAEQRYVLGIAYQAGRQGRITKGKDEARDYFTPAELEKAAWSFLAEGPQVGAFHVDGTTGQGLATVVESYIYRNPVPWDLGNDLVAKSGDWLIGAILDPRAWDGAKAGRINGWSPQGVATRRRRRLVTASPG